MSYKYIIEIKIVFFSNINEFKLMGTYFISNNIKFQEEVKNN